ncbi:MAG: tRNA lysidine(34) synthetase TilS [Anaerolineales bacterium]|nr:tRNA lysidine(34) synthetase TilS [Anaerolineales bacterium]
MYTKISDYIAEFQLIIPGQRVLVAVSGGPDSITLLDALVHLGCTVIAAHFDHQVRPESASDAEYVANLAKQYGCECVIERAGKEQLFQSGMSLEEAARIYRYQFLWRAAVSCQADVVAVGHNADDQVETILMHLLRGAGPTGLRGMLPKTLMNQWADPGSPEKNHPISLIRPLLSINRTDIMQHCSDLGIFPRWDSSNLDQTFFRNRLRHELLPLMETYNAGIRTHLLQIGHLMTEQEAWVSAEVNQRFYQVCRKTGPVSYAVLRSRFLTLPTALQGAFLVSLLGRLLPEERNLSFAVIERIIKGIRTGKPRRMPLLSDFELIQTAEEGIICTGIDELAFPQYPLLETGSEAQYLKNGSDEFNLGYGWKLLVEVFPAVKSDTYKNIVSELNPVCAAFDMDQLDGLIRLRGKLQGDRISFDTRGLSKKVSDVLMESRVPSILRNRWPLLSDQVSVLWLPGLRRSTQARISRTTKTAVLVRLTHPLETLRMDLSSELISGEMDFPRSRMDKALAAALYMKGSVSTAAFELGIRADLLFEFIHEWQQRTGIHLLEPDGDFSTDGSCTITSEGMQILMGYLKLVP